MLKRLQRKIAKCYGNFSLQAIITVPFLLQIFITVGLVGYLSWRNGEQAVNNVTSKLRNEVTVGVKNHLENYLETPHLIVKLEQKNSQLNLLNFADYSTLQQDFWSTIQLFNSVRAIYLGNQAGKFIYIKQEEGKFFAKEVTQTPDRQTYILNNLGQREKLVERDRYDPRNRPWYTKTQQVKVNNWSEIYPFSGGELGITAAGFLKDSQGKIQGIVGVDLILSGIANFLQGIEISPNGQVFILERNGYLVATSTGEAPFTYDPVAKKEQRLLAVKSQNLLTQATANYLTAHSSSLSAINRPELLDFKLKSDRQLVQILPYQDDFGLDWLIVVVVPEADFMGEIKANTRNTVWLCLGALTITAVFGVYTSRRITRPIANLSQVTTLIAQSARVKKTGTDFYPIVKAKSIKELKILAESFNEMVIQLKTAFKNLENTNEELENRVKQRTKALIAAKEAADAANQAKSEFLAHMSHELRTPLHAILGFTQVSLQDPTLQPQQKENLAIVRRSGEHLLTLINDVLEMSKIEAGSVTLEEKSFDLYLLLQNLAKMFSLLSQSKNIKLVFNIASSLPQYIKTDPVKLHQVLINLIENAIKFTEQGKITLKVQLNDYSSSINQQITFTVEDTGCGIAPSELQTIFAPFTQTKQITQQEGTGLGLAISQQFVRLLGGEIVVESIVGQGSSFKFQIPVTVVDPNHFLASSTVEWSTNEINSVVKIEPNLAVAKPSSQFQITSLADMSSEWIEKLQQAAIEVDADLIFQLIAQITPNQSHLAQELTRMLNNFQYDEIIELTTAIKD